MSNYGYQSAEEWAKSVTPTDPHDLGDIERAVSRIHSVSRSEYVAADGHDQRNSNRVPGWVGITLMLGMFFIPLFGAAQYWSGGGGGTHGGNLSVEYDSGRAALIAPICFLLVVAIQTWSNIDWFRTGRIRETTLGVIAAYFSGAAGLGLLLARSVGVDISFGASLASTAMWVCLVFCAISCVLVMIGSHETDERRDRRAKEKLRSKLTWERSRAADVLVARGLLDKAKLKGLNKPFGFYLEDGNGK